MRATFFSDALDWTAEGYSARPTPANDPELLADPDASSWQRVESVVAQAKRGAFDDVSDLVAIYDSAGPVLRYVCASLLGDLGHSDCYSLLIERSKTARDSGPRLDFVMSLVHWGKLAAVPPVLGVFRDMRSAPEAEAFPLLLSMLLEGEWGPMSDLPEPAALERYEALVIERYLQLKEEFGTENAIIFNGKRASVKRVAELLLARLSSTDYYETTSIPILRRRFEAATGVDCSRFFKDGDIQPITAAAIVEEFLESADHFKYEPGVRYFFGHRIPD